MILWLRSLRKLGIGRKGWWQIARTYIYLIMRKACVIIATTFAGVTSLPISVSTLIGKCIVKACARTATLIRIIAWRKARSECCQITQIYLFIRYKKLNLLILLFCSNLVGNFIILQNQSNLISSYPISFIYYLSD